MVKIPPRKREELKISRQQTIRAVARMLFGCSLDETLNQICQRLTERFPDTKIHIWSQAVCGFGHLKGPKVDHLSQIDDALQARVKQEQDSVVREQLQAMYDALDLSCLERPDPADIRAWQQAEAGTTGEAKVSSEVPVPAVVAPQPPGNGSVAPRSAQGISLLDLFGLGNGQPANVQVIQDASGNASIIKSQPGTEVVTRIDADGSTTIKIRPVTEE